MGTKLKEASIAVGIKLKQSTKVVLSESCSEKFHKIHRKTLLPEPIF